MDAYDKKLKELQTYAPFLTKMIAKLEKAGDKSKEAQLTKMKFLKDILTDRDKKLKLDTLTKCEEVSICSSVPERSEASLFLSPKRHFVHFRTSNSYPLSEPSSNFYEFWNIILMSWLQVLHKLYEKVEGVPLITPGSPTQEEKRQRGEQQQPSLSSFLQKIHDTQHSGRRDGECFYSS